RTRALYLTFNGRALHPRDNKNLRRADPEDVGTTGFRRIQHRMPTDTTAIRSIPTRMVLPQGGNPHTIRPLDKIEFHRAHDHGADKAWRSSHAGTLLTSLASRLPVLPDLECLGLAVSRSRYCRSGVSASQRLFTAD